MAAQKTASTPATPALLKVKQTRTPPFALVKNAPRVPVKDANGDETRAFVTRGKRSNDASESAQEYLVHVNGDKMTGLPLPVIGYAILGGAVPRAQVEEVLALI